MTRALRARAAVALALLSIFAWIALTRTPRLGLDLRGRTRFVLDALGVAEPTLARSGARRIVVELPGVQNPAAAGAVLGRTAQLTGHPVLGAGANPVGAARVLPDEDGAPLRLGPAAVRGGQSVRARAQPSTGGFGHVVAIGFGGAGGQAWQELTAAAACAAPGDPQRRVAIVLDDRVISSPAVERTVACGVGIVGGSTRITGRLSAEAARDLAVLIEGGALPLPVEIVEQRTVGPALGADVVASSAQAAVPGVAVTAIFLLAGYRMVGLAAVLGHAGHALVAYAALTGRGAMLTLPGSAGFVLAVGMAVDANVLVAERAREEHARRPGDLAGGATLADFALALVIGIVAGTTSTIAVAAPLATEGGTRRPAPPPRLSRPRPLQRHSSGAVLQR